MAIVLKVQWVDLSAESESHRRVKHIGGACGDLQWKHSHDFAVKAIEQGEFDYYVERDNRAARVSVAKASDGSKFLSVNDEMPQPLLNLPEFPAPPARN